MKKLIVLLCSSFCLSPVLLKAQTRTLNKVLELKMPKSTGDELCGTRGAAVCWNPKTKKYYAAFAGNIGFPLAVFDITGNRVSDDLLTTQVDTRGLWYNPTTQKICGNGYSDNGWFSYTLDNTGIPSGSMIDYAGVNQPDDNSVGCYDTRTNEVIFFSGGKLFFYKDNATSDRSLALQLGNVTSGDQGGDKGAGSDAADYNSFTVIYTGITGSELGVLNTKKRQIECYDYKNGSPGISFGLPEDAPVEPSFNFSFANGIYWLFDMAGRKWIGYH